MSCIDVVTLRRKSLNVIMLVQAFCFTLWSDGAGGRKQSITNHQSILSFLLVRESCIFSKVKSGPDSLVIRELGTTALQPSPSQNEVKGQGPFMVCTLMRPHPVIQQS
jgi:hypothetical protein